MKRLAFRTAVDAFADSLEHRSSATAIELYDGRKEPEHISFFKLYEEASRAAWSLDQHGLRSGDLLLLLLPTSRGLFATYLAAWSMGVVPILMPPPRRRPLGEYATHLNTLATRVGARHAVVPDALVPECAECLVSLSLSVDDLCAANVLSGLDLRASPSAIAHLQATSGSTGAPRLGIVRHANIMANVRAIGEAIEHQTGDRLVSWLPFFHDMGLIGFSYALFWQCGFTVTDPRNFVRDPMLWLRMMMQSGGTLSPAPNSAFQACTRLARRRTLEGLDLSTWRVALCGAEPVHARTVRRFCEVFRPYGFRANSFVPVYGLAEATLAATISNIHAPPQIDKVDADLMEQRAICTPVEGVRRVSVVSVGRALPGHAVRVVDSEGRPLPDRTIGEIEFDGPSVIEGYWGDNKPNPFLKRPDGFLRTGDMGYLAAGQLYVTGRKKDIIIIHGRNFIPSQIEGVVAHQVASHIVKGVAAFGLRRPGEETETLHVLVEYRAAQSKKDRAETEQKIREALDAVFGIRGAVIAWVVKGTIPKTTSGKIQRYRCRMLLMDPPAAAHGSL